MHPKAMFLYGTNKEDGKPNFGLFTWITGCWTGEDSIMCCIGVGKPKPTQDRILAEGKFSANLVTEAMLPLADYLGNNSGYDPRKMDIPMNIGRGKVLDVPVLLDSPLIYELEPIQRIPMADNSDIFICKIWNVQTVNGLDLESESSPEPNCFDKLESLISKYTPIMAVGREYFALNPISKGRDGQWKGLRESR